MSSELEREYVVLMEVGRGKFGTVYKCTPRGGSDEEFAVKSIDKTVVGGGDSLDGQCLLKEHKMMNLVCPHPNILTLHHVYEDHTHLHLLLEFCDRSDLYDRIRFGPIPEPEAGRIMAQLMQAISHCHGLGVAHRDVKPGNILLKENGRLKLGDFGSAEMFKEGEGMRGLVGTAYYVAPEVVAGRDYNEKVDVWSAGVILYVMLGGAPPFDGQNEVEILEAVLRANLRFPSRYFRGVSALAKDLLRRMLSRDVSRRLSADGVLKHPWFSTADIVN